ncbi:MAG TPA: hypothetical protein VHW01_17505 [Polyangiaceae bacterium]|jgi:hypothetical protein|nr:hypothetical protein [Polyangiaceae bacterium]
MPEVQHDDEHTLEQLTQVHFQATKNREKRGAAVSHTEVVRDFAQSTRQDCPEPRG